MHTEFKRGKFL